MLKYKNKKCEYNGIKFDSKKEMNRYKELIGSPLVKNLQLQVPYELIPKFELNGKKYRPITYRADFVYEIDGKTIIEDTKGMRTDVYKLKKKLMAYKGFEITEV